MTWHLHYDDLIRYEIFKLLNSAIFPILLFDIGWNHFKITYSFKTTGHFTKYLLQLTSLVKNHQIHMHVTTKHHLSSHSINSLKTKKTSHSIICSLNSQTTLWTHNKKVYTNHCRAETTIQPHVAMSRMVTCVISKKLVLQVLLFLLELGT